MIRAYIIHFAALLPFLAAGDPALIRVQVIEGAGVVYPIGSRATRGITVQVTDDAGRPVEGALVSFLLPEEGPGGVFPSGGRTEIATTKGDGLATVWGMQWNRIPGPFEVRITAAKGQTRAGTICSQSLTTALAVQDGSERTRVSAHGHKWVWISLAVAGAAAGGVAATALTGHATAASPPADTVQIGTPTIALGHP